MSKREIKKEHILECGIEVMKVKGYHGTSVKDIVDKASVPKGSFYNYFESKEVFAIEALEAVAEQSMLMSKEILHRPGQKPLVKLETFFQAGADWMEQCEYKGGCFIGNIAQEMSDSNEAIRLKARQIFKRNTRLVSEVLEEAKSAGELKLDLDCEQVAEFLFNAWEGSLMRTKASKCKEPIEVFIKTWPSLLS